MFAIGHFGIGYLIGKASSRLFDVKLNLGLLFSISVLPDIDLLMFYFVNHRGPLHFIMFSLIVCLPFFIIYQQKVFPYLHIFSCVCINWRVRRELNHVIDKTVKLTY